MADSEFLKAWQKSDGVEIPVDPIEPGLERSASDRVEPGVEHESVSSDMGGGAGSGFLSALKKSGLEPRGLEATAMAPTRKANPAIESEVDPGFDHLVEALARQVDQAVSERRQSPAPTARAQRAAEPEVLDRETGDWDRTPNTGLLRPDAAKPPALVDDGEGPELFMLAPQRFAGMREVLRGAKNKLAAMVRDEGRKIFLFTGTGPKVGVSTMAFNLALVAAWDLADQRILIIDANLHQPTLHSSFQVSATPGLLDLLISGADLGDVLVNSGVPNLDLITIGQAGNFYYSPFDLGRLGSLFDELRAYYDLILIDASPALRFSDTRILSRRADGVVIVLRANHTRTQVAVELRKQLEEEGAYVVGAILNRRQFVIPQMFYRFLR